MVKSQIKKVKIARKAQEYLALFGIRSDRDRFNETVLSNALIFGVINILLLRFLLYDAKSFREYTDSSYTTSAAIFMLISFINVAIQKVNIVYAIATFEKIVEMSKCNFT